MGKMDLILLKLLHHLLLEDFNKIAESQLRKYLQKLMDHSGML